MEQEMMDERTAESQELSPRSQQGAWRQSTAVEVKTVWWQQEVDVRLNEV